MKNTPPDKPDPARPSPSGTGSPDESAGATRGGLDGDAVLPASKPLKRRSTKAAAEAGRNRRREARPSDFRVVPGIRTGAEYPVRPVYNVFEVSDMLGKSLRVTRRLLADRELLARRRGHVLRSSMERFLGREIGHGRDGRDPKTDHP